MTERWAWAEIDLDAIAHNVGHIGDLVAPSEVWAVVKADGYGHGAIAVARAALAAGATGLAVALTAEGVELRDAGIDAPILVLSEQPAADAPALIGASLTPTITTPAGAEAIAAASHGAAVGVHVNVDTGMQRVGFTPEDALGFLRDVRHDARLEIDGVYSHMACADDPSAPANAMQMKAFDDVVEQLRRNGALPARVHLANSAAALAFVDARHSLVRLGIAMYGIVPGPGVAHLCEQLRPALSLHARVSQIKRVAAGSSISYGWTHRFATETTVATVPLGYADGVPRRMGTLPDQRGADVLIGGRRHPIVGVVTMDQLMVDVGDAPVAVGDQVTLIGQQDAECITADDWAARLGTIGYEIVCGIGPRVPRVVRASGSGS